MIKTIRHFHIIGCGTHEVSILVGVVYELVRAPTPEGDAMIQAQLPDFYHLGYTLAALPLESCDAHDEVALTEHSTDRVLHPCQTHPALSPYQAAGYVVGQTCCRSIQE